MDKNLNTAVICLGGNTSDAGVCIAAALEFIMGCGCVRRSSGLYRTEPEYAGETEPYLNEVIEFATSLDYERLQEQVKEYESGVRAMCHACGLVNLDIDVVYWNGAVVRQKDSVAAYFRTGMSKLESDCL